MINNNLTIIIPIYNEEKHIIRAIESIANQANQIIVVDSESTDKSLQLIRTKFPQVEIITYKADTFSKKMNFAIHNDLVKNNWVMRLDADEVIIDPEIFFKIIYKCINNENSFSGIYINRRYYFNNNWVRYGDMYPRKVMRIFIAKKAQYENKNLDEKVLLEGESIICDVDIADINLNNTLYWIKKHVMYAKKEADDINKYKTNILEYDLEFDNKTHRNKKIYYSFPIFIRPIIYYFFRLISKRGYKDNTIGNLYHLLHSIVYREIVDFYIFIKIVEALLFGKFKYFKHK